MDKRTEVVCISCKDIVLKGISYSTTLSVNIDAKFVTIDTWLMFLMSV